MLILRICIGEKTTPLWRENYSSPVPLPFSVETACGVLISIRHRNAARTQGHPAEKQDSRDVSLRGMLHGPKDFGYGHGTRMGHGAVHDILRFGAAHARDSTGAIVAAIAAATHGDTVHIPTGHVFLTRPFNISKDGISLQIDGTLQGMTERWPIVPPLPTYGRDRDGAKPHRHQALIMLHAAKHVALRGHGTIDGQGEWWWNARRSQPHAGRPHLIEVHSCAHVEIAGLSLVDSPFWTLHLYASEHVHVHRVIIRVHARPRPPPPPDGAPAIYEGMAPLFAPNTDGIDPDSSRHVLIEHCDVSCGDDHVAIKSGMNEVARGGSQYMAENITVRHNIFRLGMGVSIGSETAGGVRNVHVYNNTFLGDGSWCVALHVKSAAQRGGMISNVAFTHNVVFNTTALMRLATFGKSIVPTAYEATSIHGLEWAHNIYWRPASGARGRRVRNKFICPSTGRCGAIRVRNNSFPPAVSAWQCVGVGLEAKGQEGADEGSCAGVAAPTKKRRRTRRGRRNRRVHLKNR